MSTDDQTGFSFLCLSADGLTLKEHQTNAIWRIEPDRTTSVLESRAISFT
jgi:hypothetical protein